MQFLLLHIIIISLRQFLHLLEDGLDLQMMALGSGQSWYGTFCCGTSGKLRQPISICEKSMLVGEGEPGIEIVLDDDGSVGSLTASTLHLK